MKLKTATPTPAPEYPRAVDAPPSPEYPRADLVAQALRELRLTQPFYTCRVVGNRLEFVLYGGSVVYWPPVKGGK
jgi:hypothetical protein